PHFQVFLDQPETKELLPRWRCWCGQCLGLRAGCRPAAGQGVADRRVHRLHTPRQGFLVQAVCGREDDGRELAWQSRLRPELWCPRRLAAVGGEFAGLPALIAYKPGKLPLAWGRVRGWVWLDVGVV